MKDPRLKTWGFSLALNTHIMNNDVVVDELLERWIAWKEILIASRENAELQTALDRVWILYQLYKHSQ